MDDFIGLLILAFLGGIANASPPGNAVSRRLAHSFQKRRFDALRAKAVKGGFGQQFDEQWKQFEHVPFDELTGMESLRVFHLTRVAHAREQVTA